MNNDADKARQDQDDAREREEGHRTMRGIAIGLLIALVFWIVLYAILRSI